VYYVIRTTVNGFQTPTVEHTDFSSAQDEAVRLAVLNPRERFLVVQSSCSYSQEAVSPPPVIRTMRGTTADGHRVTDKVRLNSNGVTELAS
jgi:hypothetical protein